MVCLEFHSSIDIVFQLLRIYSSDDYRKTVNTKSGSSVVRLQTIFTLWPAKRQVRNTNNKMPTQKETDFFKYALWTGKFTYWYHWNPKHAS